MRRKHADRGRHIAPLLLEDRCGVCGDYLIPREFRTGQDAYRLPAGWLSASLRPHGEELVHTGCSGVAAGDVPGEKPWWFLSRWLTR